MLDLKLHWEHQDRTVQAVPQSASFLLRLKLDATLVLLTLWYEFDTAIRDRGETPPVKITAQQLGLNPVLMAAANSSGGVMGKMIDAQSIVVASTATKWYGHEGSILRYVFFHSIALAFLVGLLVMAQAYLPPFTALVPAPTAIVAPAP